MNVKKVCKGHYELTARRKYFRKKSLLTKLVWFQTWLGFDPWSTPNTLVRGHRRMYKKNLQEQNKPILEKGINKFVKLFRPAYKR